MVDDTTGYVRLRDFSETTDRELGKALEDLSGKGMGAPLWIGRSHASRRQPIAV